MNFKVGDTIKIVKKGCHVPELRIGDIHTITEITNYGITTEKENYFNKDIDFDEFILVNAKNNEETKLLNVQRYIIKKDATIVFWTDGTKTIVKLNKEDAYDKRLGFFYAWFQKTSGLTRNKANKFIDNLIEEEVK